MTTRVVDAYLAEGRRASIPKKGAVRIQAGGRSVTLADRRGFLTNAGRYYDSKQSLDLWDRNWGTREGYRGTYALHRQLGPVLVSVKHKRADGTWDLKPTAHGLDFWRNHQEEYDIEVPLYRRIFRDGDWVIDTRREPEYTIITPLVNPTAPGQRLPLREKIEQVKR
jgi:hypothetical protein